MARTKQPKKKPGTMPRLTDSSAEVFSEIEDTESECDSVAMEEEEISEPIQSEDQTKYKEIQDISRALANATGSQMHYENCIALAAKFPNSDFEEKLEINKMQLEKAKVKTPEIQAPNKNCGEPALIVSFSAEKFTNLNCLICLEESASVVDEIIKDYINIGDLFNSTPKGRL
ncbi:hypothetical protein NPIL_608421 [Nephila pilipes]|uniref:Uncharacterized protein n=1 Tax=Nephila pilipes TaxID=299642 RepID=A0A8X6IZQ7_NEPPI|nr:hypothetical protein NPIL_608421 [Nephila pilipes]